MTTEYSTYRTLGQSWQITLPYRRTNTVCCPRMTVAPRLPPLFRHRSNGIDLRFGNGRRWFAGLQAQ